MEDSASSTVFRQKLELLIVSKSEHVLNRVKQLISKHNFNFQHIQSEALNSGPLRDLYRAQIVLISQEENESLGDYSVRVHTSIQHFPRSRIVAVLGPSVRPDNLEVGQHARIFPLSQSEFSSGIKLEYLVLYLVRAQHLPILTGDLFSMTVIGFSAYVWLPLNQRYLSVIHKNMKLSDERFAKVSKAESLSIQTKDADKYLDYINTYYDKSGAGLKKRAKALFYSITSQSLAINEHLMFDLRSDGQDVLAQGYERLSQLCLELIEILRVGEDLWDLFLGGGVGEFSHYWRSPWIAVYGTMLSLKSGLGDPRVVFMSALFCDVGIYDTLDGTCHDYFFSEDRAALNQSGEYRKHPLLSLNRCLIKRLPIEEAVKSVMVCTHESYNEKGFPNQVPADKLPVESQIVRFAELIDHETLFAMKNLGVGFRFLREKLWERENQTLTNFNSDFLASIADSLV